MNTEIRWRVARAVLLTAVFILIIWTPASAGPQAGTGAGMEESMKQLVSELSAQYGNDQKARIQSGIAQVADFWRPEDGNQEVFEAFVRRHFAGDEKTLTGMFTRFEHLLEQMDGHMQEIYLNFRWQSDIDIGEILPFDEIFAAYNPSAHVSDDLFQNKLAFVVLLNFPLTTLEQRLTEGENWSRRQWAEARLAQRFGRRVPAEVNQAISRARAEAGQYIAGYNIWMHHLVDKDGNRMFPPKLRLLTHWNLRDEIKAQYSKTNDGGLARQRMIQKVLERIVTQTIPEVVVDNPYVDWDPYTNEVNPAAVKDSDRPVPEDLKVVNDREPDTRYEIMLNTFLAAKKADPYSPKAPTLIDRRFDENREIPEERVQEMFEQMLSSPLLAKVAALIQKRLGRDLEPFDIWYNGFRPRGAYTEEKLDEIVKARYPTPKAFEQDIKNLLLGLDFPEDRAEYLAGKILVDPARGSGHAWGAGMRSEKAHLRTRVGEDGMDYKGFNIAVHEMGHNVEQVLSLSDIDHTLLSGVPNTAFTEALAFVFQARDLDLLGLSTKDEESEALRILDDFWGACEIAAVALVDMAVWHWMYDHPETTPAELKKATIEIAQGIWNKYYAPVFNKKDVILLGVYSHMIQSFLYLPDYPIGHLIAVQVEEQMEKAGHVGPEFERMAAKGSIAPDLWMKNATGHRVGAEALLTAAQKAIDKM